MELDEEDTKYSCGGSRTIPNEGSTARDFLARERNFLSWIKLSITLWAISAALILRFHVGPRQTLPAFEIAAGKPLSALFFVAALASLITGTAGFYSDTTALRNRVGFISIGRWTQFVVMGIALLTIACCILLLVGQGQSGGQYGLGGA